MRKQVGQLEFIGSFPEALPEVGLPEVAFAGRSNVGKSSALNVLLKRKGAARVSARPGRTQTINLFKVGDAVCFADLPGYGYAKVPEAVLAKWKPMVEGYFATREALKLVVVLVDVRHEANPMDAGLLDGLEEAGIPYAVIATKIDKLSKHQRKPTLAKLADGLGVDRDAVLPFSGRTGEGGEAVWDVIEIACRRRR